MLVFVDMSRPDLVHGNAIELHDVASRFRLRMR
jgi:hypothetical protein